MSTYWRWIDRPSLGLICGTNLTMGPQVVSSLNGSLIFVARVCCCGPFLVNGAMNSLLFFLFHLCKTNNNEVHYTYLLWWYLTTQTHPLLPLLDHYVILTLLLVMILSIIMVLHYYYTKYQILQYSLGNDKIKIST